MAERPSNQSIQALSSLLDASQSNSLIPSESVPSIVTPNSGQLDSFPSQLHTPPQPSIPPSGIVASSSSKSSALAQLTQEDAKRIENILVKYVNSTNIEPRQIFNFLLGRADLPDQGASLKGTWTGNLKIDAYNLVKYAREQGTNPNNRRFMTLGSLLREMLDLVGFEDQATLVAIIVRYQLYKVKSDLQNLIAQYQVPISAQLISQDQQSIGPDIEWEGPTDILELQNYVKPEREFLDVGMLMQAIQQARSVCRVEFPGVDVTGTGFLIADNLLLTNYHVLKPFPDADINAYSANALLRFGCFSSSQSDATQGQTFKLDSTHPIVAQSPKEDLDFVLLRVEESIYDAKNVKPVTWDLNSPPFEHMELSILQHPEGRPMQLALSSNGVVKVNPHRKRLQYWTLAKGGASGSPCFDASWRVVALHHAERSRPFGTIREGIPFSFIYEAIEQHLA